jgi:ankyrin repeat protein
MKLQSYSSCLLLNQNGSTALIAAAIVGHESVATLLLDAKADVNHADNVRHSSIHYAGKRE